MREELPQFQPFGTDENSSGPVYRRIMGAFCFAFHYSGAESGPQSWNRGGGWAPGLPPRISCDDSQTAVLTNLNTWRRKSKTQYNGSRCTQCPTSRTSRTGILLHNHRPATLRSNGANDLFRGFDTIQIPPNFRSGECVERRMAEPLAIFPYGTCGHWPKQCSARIDCHRRKMSGGSLSILDPLQTNVVSSRMRSRFGFHHARLQLQSPY
jgi:hypothetical protein